MPSKSINIVLDDELYSLLEKRAKKSLLDIDTLVMDIIRRSMLSYRKTASESDKTDDALVSLFSRKKKGRSA